MTTPGTPTARRRVSLPLALGAVAAAALVPVGAAQFGSTGDLRLVVTGGEHEGEYVLSDVTFFLCAFGLPEPGWFDVQYFADDQTAWPSSVQAGHRGPDAPEVDTPDVVIGFGDMAADGAGYVVWEAQGEGTVESRVVEEGETATLTLEATTSTGVAFSLEVVCDDVYRFEGGPG